LECHVHKHSQAKEYVGPHFQEVVSAQCKIEREDTLGEEHSSSVDHAWASSGIGSEVFYDLGNHQGVIQNHQSYGVEQKDRPKVSNCHVLNNHEGQ